MLDTSGCGALSPAQLRSWLEGRAPLTACSEALLAQGDWCTAVLARLLVLHARRGRAFIKDLMASPEGHELALALHAWEASEAAAADGASGSGGAPSQAPAAAVLAAAAAQQAGWVAPAAVAAMRLRFAELDIDRDGLLTPEDFSRCSGWVGGWPDCFRGCARGADLPTGPPACPPTS